MSTTPYDRAFFESQVQGALRSARQVVPIVLTLIQPRSVLDVGCGLGAWLSVFLKHGVEDILGVDGEYVDQRMLVIPGEKFVSHDLTKPLNLQRSFDLVISLEVGEHLPAECADSYVEGLVSHGKLVLFSAAIPGQNGDHHVNEQWPEYWRALFERRGYTLIDCLRRRLWNNELIEVWYRQNTFLFAERELLQRHSILVKENIQSERLPLAIVHPDLFRSPPGLRVLLRAFPQAVVRAARRRMSRKKPDGQSEGASDRWQRG